MTGTRKGFTLVEMAVSILIMGILAALLLTGVQAARESARRAACMNNLRQIGVALNGYAAAHGTFPAGISGNGYSYLSMILPELEQASLFNAINFRLHAVSAQNRSSPNYTAYSSKIATLLCPSDGLAQANTSPISYPGNRGVGFGMEGSNDNGAFTSFGATKPQDFTDGMGNTAAASEWLIGYGNGAGSDRRRFVHATGRRLLAPQDVDRFVDECNRSDQASQSLQGKGWLLGDYLHSNYNHTNSPNMNTCTNEDLVQHGAWTASSEHGGNVKVLTAAGNVRPFKASTDRALWRALGTRNGGETIHDD